MRLILDECLPKRLTRELPGHDSVTVPMAGLAGLQNGDLLRQISGKFEGFITIDGNLAHQQNTGKLPFGVVVLAASSNKIEDIRPQNPPDAETRPSCPGSLNAALRASAPSREIPDLKNPRIPRAL